MDDEENRGEPEAVGVPYSQFTCHPLTKFGIGTTYNFESGMLKFYDKEESDKFEALLAKMDYRTKVIVRKIDQSAAEAVIKAHQMTNATKNIDSSVNANRSDAEVGTKPILPPGFKL